MVGEWVAQEGSWIVGTNCLYLLQTLNILTLGSAQLCFAPYYDYLPFFHSYPVHPSIFTPALEDSKESPELLSHIDLPIEKREFLNPDEPHICWNPQEHIFD